MLVTEAQARLHLRVEDDADIAVYLGAAVEFAQQFLNRRVYADETEMAAAVLVGTAGVDPIVANDLIRAAILLVAGHLYANREDVGNVQTYRLPMGSQALLMPFRTAMGI